MLLERLSNYAKTDAPCYVYEKRGEKIIYHYRQLARDSDRIAAYLTETLGEDKTPVVVYGHKSPFMLAAFIGCVKSGRCYVPVDEYTPATRVEQIINKVAPKCIFNLSERPLQGAVDMEGFSEIIEADAPEMDVDIQLEAEDLYYIIFTSGSTGEPKGVTIPYRCLDHFVNWALSLVDHREGLVFLNQAPFSFDLSVMDLYMSLGSGGCLHALDKDTQSDYKELYLSLSRSNANVWVSTPSFVDLCLADRQFNQELMPKLEVFLFCGEILSPKTAKRLMDRFPRAKVINTYGPTESTVAVTSVKISPEMAAAGEVLPIGRPKPGTILAFLDEEGNFSDSGEILILGDTVSAGYFKEPEKTSQVFKEYDIDGKRLPGYHTGDLGYIKEGLYYCSGRTDNQIKLHGYRIELGDVEANLLRLPEVRACAVLPVYGSGKVQRLVAYVVTGEEVPDPLEKAAELREALAAFVNGYMIPQRFVFLDELPRTNNGKVDRKALSELKQ